MWIKQVANSTALPCIEVIRRIRKLLNLPIASSTLIVVFFLTEFVQKISEASAELFILFDDIVTIDDVQKGSKYVMA